MKIFDEHHDMFRQAVRAFVQKEVEPHVEEWEAAGQMPKSIWPRMGELGFLGVEYDAKNGGAATFSFSTLGFAQALLPARITPPHLTVPEFRRTGPPATPSALSGPL